MTRVRMRGLGGVRSDSLSEAPWTMASVESHGERSGLGMVDEGWSGWSLTITTGREL